MSGDGLFGGAITDGSNKLIVNGGVKFGTTGQTTITSAGVATLSNSTASSSTTTGALVVTGGIGIGGAANLGSSLTVANRVRSTNGGFYLQNSVANSSEVGLVLEGAWPWTKYLDTETSQNSYGEYIDGNVFFAKRIPFADRNSAVSSVGSNVYTINLTDGATVYSGSLTATSFIKSGGTSSQFLKADGSVDNNTYLTSLSNLSAGSGLIGTAYNGSAAQTFRVDTGRAAAQIINGSSLNKVRDSIVNLIPTSTPTAGYYTPTISGTVNVTSSTMNECRWTRIGDIVTVSGSVLILPTTISSSVGFQITLPIDTEHPSIYELSGVGSATELSINKLVNITGLTSSNTAAFNYVASQNSASDVLSFMFTYKVIPL